MTLRLDEVLLLCLLVVLAGAERIVDIARFGEKKLTLLRRFRPFSCGTPSHDQLGTVLASLDATAWMRRPSSSVSSPGSPPGTTSSSQPSSPHDRHPIPLACRCTIHMAVDRHGPCGARE